MTCFDSLKRPPVGPFIAGGVVVVQIGAAAVHFYVHKPIYPEPDHQAGLYAVQPVALPDNHHPDRAPPEPPGRLITQVSTATATTQIGPISWFIPGGWPPSST
jgi:hypothetical protein